jgi:hypothetical protein
MLFMDDQSVRITMQCLEGVHTKHVFVMCAPPHCSSPLLKAESSLLSQLQGPTKTALRHKIFQKLLVVLRFDPPESRNVPRADLLHRCEELFDAFCQEFEAEAPVFVKYCKDQCRPYLGKVPAVMTC